MATKKDMTTIRNAMAEELPEPLGVENVEDGVLYLYSGAMRACVKKVKGGHVVETRAAGQHMLQHHNPKEKVSLKQKLARAVAFHGWGE